MKILRQTLFLLLLGSLLSSVVTGCSDLKSTSVSWNDIARTIPSNPKYVVAVNTDFEADSALNDLWGTSDVIDLLTLGVSLDSVKPDHFVVVAIDNATFITWPLPNPRETAQKVSDWNTASLNNTVDAHICVQGNASLVVSSTQAWVVNNVYGEKYVNDILSSAMNTKAANSPILENCIIDSPTGVKAVVPYEDKYYSIEVTHQSGRMDVDVDAYDKLNRKLPVIEGLGHLPIEYVDEASLVSPFAVIAVDKGSMPGLLKRLAKLGNDKRLVTASNLMGSAFEDVSGDVLARWNKDEFIVKMPYPTDDAADLSAQKIKKMISITGRDHHIKIKTKKDTLIISTPFTSELPPLDRDKKTPHMRSQSDFPSAIAFARMDIGHDDIVEAYFELAPEHAHLQINYDESKSNTAKVVQLIKTIVFKTL